jgi:hypothetical protein
MKTKVKFLIENGLSIDTISNMNDKQINLLFEKFNKFKKQKTEEQVTPVTEPPKTSYEIKGPGNLPNNPKGTGYKVEMKPDGTVKATPMETEMTEGDTESMMKYDAGLDPDQDIPTEGEIKEKFESLAQRNFFWAKCNTSKGVKKQKWCEMAREFEDSTSKKQSETMPKKKHPEKTVKYKKEKTNENLQKFIENTIVEMLEKRVDARMTKKDLLEAIKKSKKSNDSFVLRKPKKVTMFSDEAPMELPIAKMFSIGKSKK